MTGGSVPESVGEARDPRTVGVEMFLALDDLTGAGGGPAVDPAQGAVIARFEKESMRRRQPDADEITREDVTVVLEGIATAHFGLGEQT